jgi:DNA-binding transcriptional MerR regulator
MAETPQIEIPNRSLFKPAEVCDLVKVQPYVLRSWEAEFKNLGVTRSGSTTRVYRREDIERVLRIKHLLLIEGLTLAGVRRKLEEEAEPPLEQELPASTPGPALNAAARERIAQVKHGLRSLLELLDGRTQSRSIPPAGEFELAPPADAESSVVTPVKRAASRERAVANDAPAKSTSPRRKRSA